jgi:GNAT superfamily N-acetyltransferase
MSIAVRRARMEDADRLPDVERSAGQLFRTIPELAWIAGDRVMSTEDHRSFITHSLEWVADGAAGPAGFLAAEQIDDELHIWELAVHADHQGRGVGRQLMRAALAHARAKGCAALTLTTFRDVAWNEAFYAKLGFATLGREALTPRLTAMLAHEAELGLPFERRCAMRLPL